MSAVERRPSWSVVVVRAWVEAGGLRVRLLHTNDKNDVDQVVVDSADVAAATLLAWLQQLADGVSDGRSNGSKTEG